MNNAIHRLSLRGWSMLMLLPAGVAIFWPRTAPQWTLMWGVAFAMYAGFKWLTWRRSTTFPLPHPRNSTGIARGTQEGKDFPCATGSASVRDSFFRQRPRSAEEGAPMRSRDSLMRQVAYLFAWPGMDAEAFLNSDRPPTTPPPTLREVAIAGGNTIGGAILMLDPLGWFDQSPRWLFGWSGIVGYMLVLHFGVFRLLSCFWRWSGIDAVPLMNKPFASTSVASLWGQRWNTAFSDLIHRFWFRPLARPLGLVHATWIGFGVSGLIHEAVMSLPARGGYGLPTLYFLFQACGILLERSRWGKSHGLGRGTAGWLFAMIFLIAPLPLFMNPAFFGNIVVPFFQALRGVL